MSLVIALRLATTARRTLTIIVYHVHGNHAIGDAQQQRLDIRSHDAPRHVATQAKVLANGQKAILKVNVGICVDIEVGTAGSVGKPEILSKNDK